MDKATYRQHLLEAYEAEALAEARLSIATSAAPADSFERLGFETMRQLEAFNVEAMPRLLARNEISPTPIEKIREKIMDVPGGQLPDWPTLMMILRLEMPADVEKFTNLAAVAEQEDQRFLSGFAEHERLLLRLGQAGEEPDAEQAQRVVLADIQAFLQREREALAAE